MTETVLANARHKIWEIRAKQCSAAMKSRRLEFRQFRTLLESDISETLIAIEYLGPEDRD
jgi:hypothetical protein